MAASTCSGEGIMPPTRLMSCTGRLQRMDSSISSIIWPMESSTERNVCTYSAAALSGADGNGQSVIGRIRPARMPFARAASIAFFDTRAAMP